MGLSCRFSLKPIHWTWYFNKPPLFLTSRFHRAQFPPSDTSGSQLRTRRPGRRRVRLRWMDPPPFGAPGKTWYTSERMTPKLRDASWRFMNYILTTYLHSNTEAPAIRLTLRSWTSDLPSPDFSKNPARSSRGHRPVLRVMDWQLWHNESWTLDSISPLRLPTSHG